MRLNLSVIILALSVVTVKSQGANYSFSSGKSTPSTQENLRVFSPKFDFRARGTSTTFEAPLPFPGSGAPPALASTDRSPVLSRSAELPGSATNESPLPFPDSGQPPASASVHLSPALSRSAQVAASVSIESPLPFPGSGEPPLLSASNSVAAGRSPEASVALAFEAPLPFPGSGQPPAVAVL
jgi:hypothetical protein